MDIIKKEGDGNHMRFPLAKVWLFCCDFKFKMIASPDR